MEREFPGKVSGKSEVFSVSEIQTIQSKILEIDSRSKSNRIEQKLPVTVGNNPNLGMIPRKVVPFFGNFNMENDIPFAAGNFRNFGTNGKRP